MTYQRKMMNLEAPITTWVEAIPLGNGLTGGLLWGEGSEIRLSLDRGDLWDLRPHPGYTHPSLDYDTVVRMAHAGETDALNETYARRSDYPTKLPGVRLVIHMPEDRRVQSFGLDMERGLGSVAMSSPGGGAVSGDVFFSARRPVAIMRLPGRRPSFSLLPSPAVEKLGYAVPTPVVGDGCTWVAQRALPDLEYVFYVEARAMGDDTLIAIAITTNRDGDDPLALARASAGQALNHSYEALLKEHTAWWSDFWSRSSISVPDGKVQRHYDFVQYLYGAGSRRGAPPIPLQGVWTADNGKIPPWHGDYHHDLNTELTYWAYLASGRFDEGMSFLDFMWSLKDEHERFARAFFRLPEGLIVPGVMALDGKPMGGWFQYTLSTTMGAWVAQSFYDHWRYTMDYEFLASRAYPYCEGVARALVGLLRPDPETMKLKLPLSTSPELYNNTQRAWMTPNTNFDLALIRSLFSACETMADVLGRSEESAQWRGFLGQLDELAVDAEQGVLAISVDETLSEPHRHFSHLMSIHPLGILHVEGSDRDRAVIEASLAQIDEIGTWKDWTGYSFSWMACIRARAGQADRAFEYLKEYLDHYTLRNGFHVNDRIGASEKPPTFTLEGNFAAAQAVHEMVLQSWNGRLRIFPAVPDHWQDVTFERLRGEGGFVVSAERRGGICTHVTIEATVDQTLRLRNPFGHRSFRADLPVETTGDDIRLDMKAGQRLTLALE